MKDAYQFVCAIMILALAPVCIYRAFSDWHYAAVTAFVFAIWCWENVQAGRHKE